MTTLHELRDMLAKAEGPSRELDAAIAAIFDMKPPVDDGTMELIPTHYGDGLLGYQKIGAPCTSDDAYYLILAERRTSSIDAALALVERLLPGWKWEVGNPFWKEGIVVCRLARPGATDWSSSLVESEDSPTAPLAILKALSEALSEALIAKEKADG